jgi:hypothetical protein
MLRVSSILLLVFASACTTILAGQHAGIREEGSHWAEFDARPAALLKKAVGTSVGSDGSGGRMAFGHGRICLRRFAPQLLLPLIATHASLRLRVNLLPRRFKTCSFPNKNGPHKGAHLLFGSGGRI